MTKQRLAICVIASIASHLVAREALSMLPEREHDVAPRRVEVTVVAPPPPEPPPPPPEPENPPESTPTPSPPPDVKPEVQRTQKKAPPQPEQEVVNTEIQPGVGLTSDPNAPPVFGVTMESTSPNGGGPAVPVGTGAAPSSKGGGGGVGDSPVPPAPAPVPAAEVTKMPLPKGQCAGKYTDAAREAEIEGVVVIDLVVDEEGRVRDIKVVESLPHGLTQAAIDALKACAFTPGERNGSRVPVRIRAFKIRFVLDQ